MPRPMKPLQGDRKARVEEMIADGCPLAEIARTLHIAPITLAHFYPEAQTPPEQRGALAAMARKFNQLPDNYLGTRTV